MISDKHIRVQYKDSVRPAGDEVVITITADQQTQTVRRRMAALMPNAKIIDITEVPADYQLGLETKPRGAK